MIEQLGNTDAVHERAAVRLRSQYQGAQMPFLSAPLSSSSAGSGIGKNTRHMITGTLPSQTLRSQIRSVPLVSYT